MSSTKTEVNLNDSVVCLDDGSDDDESFSVSDFVNFDKTLPPGVAPENFIVLDECIDVSNEDDKSEKNEEVTILRNEEQEIESPLLRVMFRDETVTRQYKKRVKDFLHNLVNGANIDVKIKATELVLEVWSTKKNRKRSCDHFDDVNSDDKTDLKTESDAMLFTIDKKPLLQDRLDVPTYGKKFDRILETSSGVIKPEEEDKSALARPKMSCWNCLGSHSIRDCPEPRNPMEIAKNRTLFQSRSGPRTNRYHVDEEQKYSQSVPGMISKDLRRALGIRDNELPNHIYRMRILGYPSGWLKEARLQHSGMNLYGSDGRRELDPMEESGEIVELDSKDQYDVKKIHDFPGFNVPSPSNTREEEKMYWNSDQYKMHSKKSMLAMLGVNKVDGYQRKKLKRSVETDETQETMSSAPSEMDVVEEVEEGLIEDAPSNGVFIPPLMKTPSKPPLPSQSEEGTVHSLRAINVDLESNASLTFINSPTLADLEKRKKQLLDELDNSNSLESNALTPVSSRTCSVNLDDQRVASVELEVTPQSQRTQSAQITPCRGSIKSVMLGTPILESTSPYSKLPSVEHFSKDVCDIMNFENLPDSTGKYEQMTEILAKVRNTLATAQHD